MRYKIRSNMDHKQYKFLIVNSNDVKAFCDLSNNLLDNSEFLYDVDLDGVCDDIDDCVGSFDDCGDCNGSNTCHDDCGVPNGDNACHDC